MRSKRMVAAAAVLAGALVLTACGGGGGGTGSGGGGGGGAGGTLKIGFMGDLTGENSGIVIPPFQGATLAVEEYNATNPAQKIELIKMDSQGTADQAVPLITKDIANIVGLIGPAFSGESKAVGPILEQGKIPSISPSATNPGLAQNGWKYWHRVVANDNDQGPAIADFFIRTKAAKKAYIISDDQEYSVGIAEAALAEFQAKGVAVERDQFAQASSDYSSTVAKVKAAAPDVIVYGGYYAQAGRLLKQLRDGGITAPFASGDGSFDAKIVEGAGQAAAEGAILSCPCLVPEEGQQTGALAKFSTDYKAKFSQPPAIYSGEGYDAATLFINAIKGGATTPDAINTAISGETLDGVSKKIAFKPNGEPDVNTVYVYQVQGGVLKLLGESTEATPA